MPAPVGRVRRNVATCHRLAIWQGRAGDHARAVAALRELLARSVEVHGATDITTQRTGG